MRVLVLLSGFAALALSCKSANEPASSDPSRMPPPAADLPELEIRSAGIDRFTVCPPPGELGQQWIPPLPPWSPPPLPPGASAPDETLIAESAGRSLTEIAVEATHREFRSCYRRGLVHHPMEDGRVAIVLRVGRDGRVARVESYAACELAAESIACMYGVAQKLRFPPPAEGAETVTIPAVFTSRDGVRRTVATPNDAYTAAAYVTLEAARPAFHACEQRARRDGRSVFATGTFALALDANGRVQRAHVDPWSGDQPLLTCAARALETLTFVAPRGGKATVITRLNFNPRQGGR
jgi:hypothetical protein